MDLSVSATGVAEVLPVGSDGPIKRRRRRTGDIRLSILDAAAAEFGARGYAGATTAAIAKRSGVAENQIFRHFTSKAELFRSAVFDPLNQRFEAFNIGQLQGPTDGSEPEITQRYIAALSRFIGEQKREFLALIRSNTEEMGEAAGLGKMGALGAFFEISQAMLTSKRGAGMTIDPGVLNRVSFAAVLGCIMFGDWLFPEDMGQEQVIPVLSNFIMYGLDGVGR